MPVEMRVRRWSRQVIIRFSAPKTGRRAKDPFIHSFHNPKGVVDSVAGRFIQVINRKRDRDLSRPAKEKDATTTIATREYLSATWVWSVL